MGGIFPAAWGQEAGPETAGRLQVDAAVYFRIGESAVDLDFEANRIRLIVFLNDLRRIQADSNYVISRIEVMGTASPDGTRERNEQLAGERAEALASWLVSEAGIPADKISVVNGGENWTGLRLMMEASDGMPFRDEMLALIDIEDRAVRKYKMMYYADSKPWLWMYEHFFPELRKGAGGTQDRASLNRLSRENWRRIRAVVDAAPLDADTRWSLLDAIDREPDAARRMDYLKELCPDAATYALLQEELVRGLLTEQSALSADNWLLLREKAAASDMPFRTEVLHIIDHIPATCGREQALQELANGEPYRYLLDRFFPELLAADRAAHSEYDRSEIENSTLGAENWRRLREMIAASEMPDKDSVLSLIDNEPDMALRERKLRALNDGYNYRYIDDVFSPELLYGVSAAARENWEQLSLAARESDIPHKDQIQEIIRTTPPGIEREKAIRALDGGESWRRIREQLLPELLLSTENVPMAGSGMGFSYELSPKAKARAAAMPESAAVAEEPAAAISQQPMQPLRSSGPVVALKTDLLLWGGVMPDFKMGAWTPNLSVEIYFAGRWSVEAGYAYASWDAFGGGLHSVSAGNIGLRSWLGKASAFRGFYLGLFGIYGQYDVQDAALGQTGAFWCAGLGAGWLQPLSRHWALEAEIRGGYRSAQNEFYDIEPGHYYFNRKQTSGKFIPQLRLQLIYRFGKGGK